MQTIMIWTGQPVLAEGLAGILRRSAAGYTCVTCSGTSSPQSGIANHQPILTILDLSSAAVDRETLETIRGFADDSKIILWVRAITREIATIAIDAGVRGVLHDEASPETLIAAIERIMEGELWLKGLFKEKRPEVKTLMLTHRESETASFIFAGLKNKAIASRMNISEGTVKVHMKRLFEKTGARSRLELASFGAEHLS